MKLKLFLASIFVLLIGLFASFQIQKVQAVTSGGPITGPITGPIPSPSSAPTNISSSIALTGLKVSYDPTPLPNAPFGAYNVLVTLTNTSSKPYTNLYFRVVELGGNLLLNADGGAGGNGSILSVSNSALGSDEILSPGESFLSFIKIGMVKKGAFPSQIDLYATEVK